MPKYVKLVLLWLCCVVVVAACITTLRDPVESPLPLGADGDPVAIMPLGDSISGSTGCWRSILWNRLVDSGYDNLDFVGKREGPECDDDYGIAEEGLLFDWLARDPADVMLVHLGSNDIRRGDSTDEILKGLSILVDQMRQVNANMVILVAQIIPMTETPMDKECVHCPGQVDELNARIPSWAKAHQSPESPLFVVDQNDGFDVDADTYDGLHTGGSGAQKMADKWFEALERVLAPV